MKTILITGSTDGIGLQTAIRVLKEGHSVIIHGRSTSKLSKVEKILKESFPTSKIDSFLADLSNIGEVRDLAKKIKQKYTKLDVLINNAGIYKTPQSFTKDGFDVRFVVNTIAPYLLTKELLDLFDKSSRVVNLSSAAQATVSSEAMKGKELLSDGEAYAQSKLALTMWTNHLATKLKDKVGVIVSLNPASFLGSKMVKEAYGMSGKDINIGVDILQRASFSDEFKDANGKYFDNDIGRFSDPHPDGLDKNKCKAVVDTIEEILK